MPDITQTPLPSLPHFEPGQLPEIFVEPLRELFQGQDLELPILSESIAHVIELCSAEVPSLDEVAEKVGHDQSLAAHVLRITNSASLAPMREIRTVDEAVRRLGTRAIGDLAVCHMVQNSLVTKGYTRLRIQMAQAAVAGVYSFRIGRLVGGISNASLLPGLMHDVGRSIALKFLYEIEDIVCDELNDDTIEYLAEALHVSLGVRLAQSWNLPLSVEVAIRYHEDYRQAPAHAESAMIANLADLLSTWALDPNRCADIVLPEHEVVRALGLDKAQLSELLSGLAEVREAARIFT